MPTSPQRSAGQSRLPFAEGDDVGRGTVKQRADAMTQSGRNPQPPSPGIADEVKVHPNQLQAFMTPREIRAKYQVLDGDRQGIEDPRSGELTNRSQNTGGSQNDPIDTRKRGILAGWHGGASQVADYTHTRAYSYARETDDEVFSRKAEEAALPPYEYRDLHGGGNTKATPGWATLADRSSAPSGMRRLDRGGWTGAASADIQDADDYVFNKQEQYREDRDYGPSLYDSIAEEGVKSPIHLSNQFGSEGKPEIAGGHHRLAVQNEINPDQPIPVLHWNSFMEARKSKGYT